MSISTPWPFEGPRPHPHPITEAVDPRPAWARYGRWLRRPNGERIEVHPIGAVAEALGKSSFTIRRWEREGTLPETPLVLPVSSGPPRRMFSTEQIQGIVLIAEEEGVAARKAAELALTRFTPRVLQLYAELFPEHFKSDAAALAADRAR